MSTDRAGKAHWDQQWRHAYSLAPVDPRAASLGNHDRRRIHEFFVRLVGEGGGRGLTLLEVGAARSAWLPYFALEFGFDVTGLDYSEIGCEQSRNVLEASGVRGRVVCADAFAPPAELEGAFDLVVSFGVVEHFEDTAACLAAFARFVKPGGRLVTLIPNFAGVLGSVQKVVNRAAYDIHVPLSREALVRAHARAGLSVEAAEHLLPLSLSIINTDSLRGAAPYARKVFSLVNRLFWAADRRMAVLPPNRATSPYIACAARRP